MKEPQSAPVTSRAMHFVAQSIPWLVLLVLTGINLFRVTQVMPIDDAYITYRVARNLAGGAGPLFNPGEQVLSITTPGYALVLAAASLVSQDFMALGLVISGLAMLAIGAFLVDLSHPVHGSAEYPQSLSWLRATVAIALTLSFRMFTDAVGMETPLYVAAILAAFSLYRTALHAKSLAGENRWLLWTAAAASAAFLIRPDGILVGATVGLHWLITKRRVPWRALGLALLLSLPWLLFAWAYYGSPVPNTLAAKVTQGLSEDAPRWAQQLQAAYLEWRFWYPAAALLAALGLLLSIWQRNSDRLLMLSWAALYAAAHTVLNVRGYPWYYVPLLPLAALLAGDGLVAIAGWVNRALSRSVRLSRSPWPRLLATVVAIALAIFTLRPVVSIVADLARITGPRPRETIYQRTGEILRHLCADDSTQQVGMSEIGLLGYLSNCHVIDFSGLLQRDLAHLEQLPAAKFDFAIKRYLPSLIVLTGDQEFIDWYSNLPWFRQRYQRIDVQEQDGVLSVLFSRQPGPANARELGVGWWRQAAPPASEATTLYFADSVPPQITVHAYLPPDSRLVVEANATPVAEFQGGESSWQDYSLPALSADADDSVRLTLVGAAGDQPAAVAWIESNAISDINYFTPFEAGVVQPEQATQMEPGEHFRATLAPARPGPVALEVLYYDRPGVQLVVSVDGEPLGVLGGADGWRTERLALSPELLGARPVLEVELHNQSQHHVPMAYVALVNPSSPRNRW